MKTFMKIAITVAVLTGGLFSGRFTDPCCR